MNLTKVEFPGRSAALWKAALLFASVSALLIAADHLALFWSLDGTSGIVDDLLGGLIAGSIFHLYERQRLRRIRERLRVIDLMNHHIRNALQPLALVNHQPARQVQMRMVQQCVRRIDWALREILPGNCDERFVTDSGVPAASPASPAVPQSVFGQWLEIWKVRNGEVKS